MTFRSKIVYALVVLVFVFTSLAAGVFAAVETAAQDFQQSDSALHIDSDLGAPVYSVAGECDMSSGCGWGSG